MSTRMAQALVPTKLDRFESDNPDHIFRQKTKHGSWVQFWGWRVYYGTCTRCSGLVTTRRPLSAMKPGYRLGHRNGTGRWPELCAACKAARQAERTEKNAEDTRHRMAKLRAERREIRDCNLIFDGYKQAPSQGKAALDEAGNPVKLVQDPEDPWEWVPLDQVASRPVPNRNKLDRR